MCLFIVNISIVADSSEITKAETDLEWSNSTVLVTLNDIDSRFPKLFNRGRLSADCE